MKQKSLVTTQHEIVFDTNDIITSKTDFKGRITYANRSFMKISNYPEGALLGRQHNVIRHPDMPRGVFRLLWNTLKEKKEFFGIVKNVTHDGHFYWVFANVTSDYDESKEQLLGYYSVRRKINKEAVRVISEIYQQMIQIEQQASTAKAPDLSMHWLLKQCEDQNVSYRDFVFQLYHHEI